MCKDTFPPTEKVNVKNKIGMLFSPNSNRTTID